MTPYEESIRLRMKRLGRIQGNSTPPILYPLTDKEDYKFKLDGKEDIQGIKISIENKKGSVRSGTDENGKPWEIKMKYAYGRIPRTMGNDGDNVDAIIGPDTKSDLVFIVHQTTPWMKGWDEDKCLIGFSTRKAAESAFKSMYNQEGFMGPIDTVSIEVFKEMLKESKKGKPLGSTRVTDAITNFVLKLLYDAEKDSVKTQSGRKAAQLNIKADKCSKCGATTKLERHHQDKNTTHNTEDNVNVLCSKCHTALHQHNGDRPIASKDESPSIKEEYQKILREREEQIPKNDYYKKAKQVKSIFKRDGWEVSEIKDTESKIDYSLFFKVRKKNYEMRINITKTGHNRYNMHSFDVPVYGGNVRQAIVVANKNIKKANQIKSEREIISGVKTGGLSVSEAEMLHKRNARVADSITNLALGILVEMEHTDDIREAEKIAKEHLAEDPNRYLDPKNHFIQEVHREIMELAKESEKVRGKDVEVEGTPEIATPEMLRKYTGDGAGTEILLTPLIKKLMAKLGFTTLRWIGRGWFVMISADQYRKFLTQIPMLKVFDTQLKKFGYEIRINPLGFFIEPVRNGK